MTDRLKGCWVAFDCDIRDVDAKPLIDAIFQLKGVASVTTEVTDAGDWMNRERIRRELLEKMFKLLEKP